MPDLTIRSKPLRTTLIVLVAGALLLLTIYDERARGILTQIAERFTGGPSASATAGPALTKRNVPAMVAFGLLYISLTVALLHLIMNQMKQTRWVIVAYGGAFAALAILVVLGRLLGQMATITPIARELIDVVLSPLPVLLLLAVFRLAPRV